MTGPTEHPQVLHLLRADPHVVHMMDVRFRGWLLAHGATAIRAPERPFAPLSPCVRQQIPFVSCAPAIKSLAPSIPEVPFPPVRGRFLVKQKRRFPPFQVLPALLGTGCHRCDPPFFSGGSTRPRTSIAKPSGSLASIRTVLTRWSWRSCSGTMPSESGPWITRQTRYRDRRPRRTGARPAVDLFAVVAFRPVVCSRRGDARTGNGVRVPRIQYARARARARVQVQCPRICSRQFLQFRAKIFALDY